jgi:hypothetical protein
MELAKPNTKKKITGDILSNFEIYIFWSFAIARSERK